MAKKNCHGLPGATHSCFAPPAGRAADARLSSELGRALRAAGHVQFGNLRHSVADGRATLLGRVRTYYLKQLAQATVLSVPGIQSVENQIVVQ